METSTLSTLPLWKLVDLGSNKLGIQCPRKECGGKAVVNKKRWTAQNGFIGRSCTYCMKTSRIEYT
jgi:hypothetical protein